MSYRPLLINDGEILLIVPPFAFANIASLGAHILQACARQAGFDVKVAYANLHYAAMIGHYAAMLRAPMEILAGERLFAASAYGVPPLGYGANELTDSSTLTGAANRDSQGQKSAYSTLKIDPSLLQQLEAQINNWVEEVAGGIVEQNFKIVGCTTMFQQTAASIALLNRIKHLRPEIVTIIGGANCEGEMAEGVASLSNLVDYVFSGESEQVFVNFLQQLSTGRRPANRIFYGQPVKNLDSLPPPEFGEYYEQLDYYLPQVIERPEKIELAYETSRGCWWGEKHRCTFCGLNGMGIEFRAKSSEKVITELKTLLSAHPYPTRLVQMTDNVMPYTFFKTLLPELAELVKEFPGVRIYYEQKANLTFEQIQLMMEAGISHTQPGIESLSTPLLRRMNKGVTAAQNIALLRYARSVGMSVDWNIMWGFPGDQRREYEETLALIPLLCHLEPPISASHMRIDRFSRYFDHPEDYGITHLRPLPSYQMILPPGIDASKVAYYFTGEYASYSHEKHDIVLEIKDVISKWQAAWDEKATHITLFFGKFRVKESPVLQVLQANGNFLLRDTRGLEGTQEEYLLTQEQASVALVGRRYTPTPEMEWAIARKIGVVIDNHQYVPLATATPELLYEFESAARS